MTEKYKVIQDTKRLRFYVERNGEFAYVDYRHYKDDIAFMHTEVPESFRGMGIGTALAEAALGYAAKQKKRIMLYCPFVSKYVKDHQQYHYLVDETYHPSFARNSASNK